MTRRNGDVFQPAREVLGNGATLVSQAVEGARTAGFAVLVPVGAVNEAPGQEGFTHFLEHLVFKGTPTRTAEQISREINGVGGYLNAYTTKEYTVFFTHLPPEHLPLGVDIVQDMLENATLKKRNFQLEQNVVLEEIALSRDDPQDALFEAHLRRWYGGGGLGLPVLGTPQSIGAATPQVVRRYFHDHYHAQGLIMAVAGQLLPKPMAQLRRKVAAWQGPGGAVGTPRTPVEHSPPVPVPAALYHRDNLGASYLTITLPIPGYGDPRRLSAVLLARALGADSSSRLFIEVREKRGLCYDVGATTGFYRNQGYFEVYATTSHKNLPEVLRLCRQELSRLVNKGLSEEEFRRVKEQVRGGYLMSQEGTSSALNRLVSNQYIHGKPLTEKDFQREMRRQTLERVNAFAKDVLKGAEVSISVLTQDDHVRAATRSMKTCGMAPGDVAPLSA